MSESYHSVKVPRIYKSASKILKSVYEGGSFQELVFNQNKHSNIKGIHALVAEAIKFNNVLSRILNQTGILKFEKFDPWLAQILLTELIFGKKKLSGDSKPILTILKYKDEILRELSVADIRDISSYSRRNHKASLKPRYVRVNTLKISLEDAVNKFKDEGWKEVQCPDSYDEYLQLVENRMFSKEYIFVKDYHINNMLVFPNGVLLHDHPAYLDRYIILQDKASCLLTCCVPFKTDSIILDMCAAPGMKTALMAACINNEGKIYAVERDVKRFNVMNELLNEFGVTCVESRLCDAGSVGPDLCKNVKYILVDPSCSGSGMTSRVENITNQEHNIDKLRLQRLSNLQGYLLRHALSNFPSAKYVTYSTCSLEEQENEMVVESVLGCAYFHGFSLINIKKKINGWKNFGSSKYECGEKCIYTRTKSDFTNGGFLAVFRRNPKNDLSAFKIKLEKNPEDSSSEEKKLKLSEQFFAYVNTLKITVEEAIQYFVDNGWNHLPSPVNYDIFLSGLQEDDNRVKEKFFEQDFHVKELLLFPMGIVDKLSEKFTYERKFILLDKVSCLAVHLLDPVPGTNVLDMSAGKEKMSLCIAARMNNEGIIYAYEPHYHLHKELTYELQVCGVSCVQTKFDSAVYSSSTDCPDVKLILVNPPCSGSGSDFCAAKKTQYSVQNKVISHSNSSNKGLILRKYVVTQFSLLRRALTEFPEAVRVVYSTRSVHPEENEDIINALLVLAKFNGFSLINVANRIEGWKNECSVKYSFVSKCLVARDNTSITKGFFIAVFERNLKQKSKCNIDSSFTMVNVNNNFTENDYRYNCLKEKEESSEEQNIFINVNKKLKLGNDFGNENSDTNNYSNYKDEEALCTESMSQKKKKKNKKVIKEDGNQMLNNDETFVPEKTKKSKKHKISEESEEKLYTENSSGIKENHSHRDKKHASKMKRKICDNSLDNFSKKSKKQKKDEVGEKEKESAIVNEVENIGCEDTNDAECHSQLEMVKKRHKKKKKGYTNETEIPNNEITEVDELYNEVCSETRKKKKKKKKKDK